AGPVADDLTVVDDLVLHSIPAAVAQRQHHAQLGPGRSVGDLHRLTLQTVLGHLHRPTREHGTRVAERVGIHVDPTHPRWSVHRGGLGHGIGAPVLGARLTLLTGSEGRGTARQAQREHEGAGDDGVERGSAHRDLRRTLRIPRARKGPGPAGANRAIDRALSHPWPRAADRSWPCSWRRCPARTWPAWRTRRTAWSRTG